ncbi:vacuolar protein sorting 55 [Colletotrichum lupini]|uniref:Vacuolar protein sorting 55 n=1 Tax=Colletotrichum lupini TaxID=145971 RepID=A0A9Q8SSL5_9PEZI|nr:vacuolar protein sorting 55 [Colletotrichum lupini]UQC82473.1 vacuolar protein sorting 55 [Colletotrichum lupini]
MPTAGLKTIIALSFVLAVGFLLVILSCALWKVYYPLLVVATYVLAPIPNWVCSRCTNPDDFGEGSGSAVLDLGRFCTGFMVVMGIALPIVLAHSDLIQVEAMVMSIIGGLLIYGTIISFSMRWGSSVSRSSRSSSRSSDGGHTHFNQIGGRRVQYDETRSETIVALGFGNPAKWDLERGALYLEASHVYPASFRQAGVSSFFSLLLCNDKTI